MYIHIYMIYIYIYIYIYMYLYIYIYIYIYKVFPLGGMGEEAPPPHQPKTSSSPPNLEKFPPSRFSPF